MTARQKQKTLTPLELEIMQALWEAGPSNVQAVQEKLRDTSGKPKLAYTTVQTMLNVLHRKGRVKRVLCGRAYEYAATISREKAASHAIHDMVDRIFGGSVDGLLMNLVKTRQIDAKKLAELAERLERGSTETEDGHD